MGVDSTVLRSCFHRFKAAFSPSPTTTSTTTEPQLPVAAMPAANQEQRSRPHEILVFVDIPDIDNVLACLSILKHYPDRKVHIILSPRPVDFSVELYPPEDQPERQDGLKTPVDRALFLTHGSFDYRLRIRRKMTPLSEIPPWLREFTANGHQEHKPLLRFFTNPDSVFDVNDKDENGVKADTTIYMEASAYRFASFLRNRGIPASRLHFYWDPKSMTKIAPGMRHASHVPDFTYGYTKNDDVCGVRVDGHRRLPVDRHNKVVKGNPKDQDGWVQLWDFDQILKITDPDAPDRNEFPDDPAYHKAVADWMVKCKESKTERRTKLREFCKTYIRTEAAGAAATAKMEHREADTRCRDLGGEKLTIITTPFDHLINEHKDLGEQDRRNLVAFIGGPFTEASRWLEEGRLFAEVTAMACFWHGLRNILINNFNIAADIHSAWRFLQKVKELGIKTLLVPTECTKGQPWALSKDDLDQVFGTNLDVKQAVVTFTNQSKALTDITLYDWVAAIVARRQDILQAQPVEFYFGRPLIDVNVKEQKVTLSSVPVPRHPNNPETGPEIAPGETVCHTSNVILLVKESSKEGCVKMCTTEVGPNESILKSYHATLVKEMQKDLHGVA